MPIWITIHCGPEGATRSRRFPAPAARHVAQPRPFCSYGRAQVSKKGSQCLQGHCAAIPELLAPSCSGAAYVKSGREFHVTARDTHDGAAMAIDRALDAYVVWLTHAWSNASPGTELGASLLGAVARLCQELPHVSPIMSELLVGHVRVTTLLYEAQLQAIRGGGPANALDDVLSSPFVRVQIGTVERMRTACRASSGPTAPLKVA
jgi:hypothetical protein